MIILLDLNYTLVRNSEQKASPFTKQIERETYRIEIIQLVQEHYVVMITARPIVHKTQTLASIIEKTGWSPQESYFNDTKMYPAHFKRSIVLQKLTHLRREVMLAIESNPNTIEMYKKLGILCLSVR